MSAPSPPGRPRPPAGNRRTHAPGTDPRTRSPAGPPSGGDTTPPATDVSPDELHSHWRRMMRVLVATDGSASAADAIGFAVDFASARDAEVTFVHVVPTVEFVPTTGGDDFGGAL